MICVTLHPLCFIHVSVLHTCVSASYMCQCDLYQTCLWCIVRLEKVQDARMAAAVLLLVKGKVRARCGLRECAGCGKQDAHDKAQHSNHQDTCSSLGQLLVCWSVAAITPLTTCYNTTHYITLNLSLPHIRLSWRGLIYILKPFWLSPESLWCRKSVQSVCTNTTTN